MPFSAQVANSANQGASHPLVVILGPTAVGKTEISIQLAETLNGEIISADSRLFYRGMDIGTAKPTSQERERVPHHLIDVAEPDETWSVANFQRQANLIISKIHQRRRLPFLVGGTGQYIQAITQNWQIPRVAPDQQLRNALTMWADDVSPAGLYDRLKVIDPKAASSIDPRNVRRTIRALEVIFTTGKKYSSQRKLGQSQHQILKIGLIRPREELYPRVDQRIMDMIQTGLIEEVKGLIKQGYTLQNPPMSAIGYFEMIHYLQGSISLDDAITSMKRRTRVYIRRQANWFKLTDPEIHWFDLSEVGIDIIKRSIINWKDTISQSGDQVFP